MWHVNHLHIGPLTMFNDSRVEYSTSFHNSSLVLEIFVGQTTLVYSLFYTHTLCVSVAEWAYTSSLGSSLHSDLCNNQSVNNPTQTNPAISHPRPIISEYSHYPCHTSSVRIFPIIVTGYRKAEKEFGLHSESKALDQSLLAYNIVK